MSYARLLVATLAAISLAACSSGGSDDDNSPSPTPASTPTITQQPATNYVAEGTAHSLSVTATGNGTLTYAWRRNTVPVAGATSATYNIPNVTGAHDGDYDCIVTNTLGSSSASTTSAVGRLIVVLTPVISEQPQSASVLAGAEVSFRVRATMNGAPNYEWRRDGIVAHSGPSDTYFIFGATEGQAGVYDVRVSSTLGGVTSAVTTSATATLSVLGGSVAQVTAEKTVVAATTGHVASVPAAVGVAYAWTVTNGTLTAGQGTRQITYTAGLRGPARIAVTVTNPAGSVSGHQDQRVVASLPVTSIFAHPVVHPGDSDIGASAAVGAGNSYTWSTQNLGAVVTVPGSLTAHPLVYGVGSTAGQYSLSVTVQDAANNSRMLSRTLDVASHVFLRDRRDPSPRSFHSATLMEEGRVLVVGGDAGIPEIGNLARASAQSRIVGTAEIFDPVTQRWADAPSTAARLAHSATLLNDGRVLVVGGLGASNNYLASGAIYDPVARSWSASGSLITARAQHTATLLADGRVLVAGGVNGSGEVAAAEIYDPGANSWNAAGNLQTARIEHSASLTGDGRVLVAGGRASTAILGSAEIFDPATGNWTAAASMSAARARQGSVLLPSGRVMQLGSPIELYDAAANTWTIFRDGDTFPPGGASLSAHGDTAILLPDGSVVATTGDISVTLQVSSMRVNVTGRSVTELNGAPDTTTRQRRTATLLSDGNVLFVGGFTAGSGLALPETYLSRGDATLLEPLTNTVTALGSGAARSAYAAAARLANGRILVAGGSSARNQVSTIASSATSLYDPTDNTWSAAASMASARTFAVAATLSNGRVLVAGGTSGGTTVHASTESYDPGANAWSLAGALAGPRYRHSLTALTGGGAIAVGGRNATFCNCTMFQSTVDRYDVTANSWSPINPLLTARDSHTATRLADGRVLVTGGYGGTPNTLADTGAVLASSELFDPQTGNWTTTGALNTARREHVAVLLADGRVLVAGGTSGTTTLDSVEIYDPAAGTWSTVAPMNAPRQSASAALLGDGRVLVANGLNGTSSAAFGTGTAEVYDPVANSWTAPIATAVPRVSGNALSLDDGRVLIFGGWPNDAGAPEFYR